MGLMSKYDNEEIGQSLESRRDEHWHFFKQVLCAIAFAVLLLGSILFLYLTDSPNEEVEIHATR